MAAYGCRYCWRGGRMNDDFIGWRSDSCRTSHLPSHTSRYLCCESPTRPIKAKQNRAQNYSSGPSGPRPQIGNRMSRGRWSVGWEDAHGAKTDKWTGERNAGLSFMSGWRGCGGCPLLLRGAGTATCVTGRTQLGGIGVSNGLIDSILVFSIEILSRCNRQAQCSPSAATRTAQHADVGLPTPGHKNCARGQNGNFQVRTEVPGA